MCSRLKDLYQSWKNDKSKKKQIFLFFVIVAKEGFDCLFDWLLYLELTMYEEGLLFGSYDFLSVFMLAAVVGLVVTGIDIASKIRRLITGISVTKVSLTDLLVMFCEDIPQLFIGLHVIYCRREKSIWQFLKAVILMIASSFFAIRISRFKKQIQAMRSRGENIVYELRTKYKRKTLLGVGHIAIAVLCVLTFIFLLINTGDIQIEDLRMDYDFSKLGIYCDVENLQFPVGGAKSWIKIVEVDDILKNGEINTKVTWNESYLRIQNFNTRNVIDKCYRREETGNFYFTQLANCTIVITGTKLHYHFKYIAPSGRYFLGDIQYNVLVTPIDSFKNVSSQLLPDLGYFQANVSQTRSRHLNGPLYGIGNKFKFYSAEDLEDINKIHAFISQNTSCFNRGRVSPHFNTEISVPCSL